MTGMPQLGKIFVKDVYDSKMAHSLLVKENESIDRVIKHFADQPRESLSGTRLIKGIVLDKEVIHPGMPKRLEDQKNSLC
jgi:hypothetical protein